MRVVNTRRETITEYDLSSGYLQREVIVKPEAIRIGTEISVEKDGKTITYKKIAWEEDDFEEVEMYIPYRVPTAQEKIINLKQKLSATDYKVIKCIECFITNREMPYNVEELHTERQAVRDKINQLEQEVNKT